MPISVPQLSARSCSFKNCFLTSLEQTPHAKLSRISSSFKVPYSHVFARILRSATNDWNDSPSFWIWVLNLCPSIMTFPRGSQIPANFLFRTSILLWDSALTQTVPSLDSTVRLWVTDLSFSITSLPAKFKKMHALVLLSWAVAINISTSWAKCFQFSATSPSKLNGLCFRRPSTITIVTVRLSERPDDADILYPWHHVVFREDLYSTSPFIWLTDKCYTPIEFDLHYSHTFHPYSKRHTFTCSFYNPEHSSQTLQQYLGGFHATRQRFEPGPHYQ